MTQKEMIVLRKALRKDMLQIVTHVVKKELAKLKVELELSFAKDNVPTELDEIFSNGSNNTSQKPRQILTSNNATVSRKPINKTVQQLHQAPRPTGRPALKNDVIANLNLEEFNPEAKRPETQLNELDEILQTDFTPYIQDQAQPKVEQFEIPLVQRQRMEREQQALLATQGGGNNSKPRTNHSNNTNYPSVESLLESPKTVMGQEFFSMKEIVGKIEI